MPDDFGRLEVYLTTMGTWFWGKGVRDDQPDKLETKLLRLSRYKWAMMGKRVKEPLADAVWEHDVRHSCFFISVAYS